MVILLLFQLFFGAKRQWNRSIFYVVTVGLVLSNQLGKKEDEKKKQAKIMTRGDFIPLFF